MEVDCLGVVDLGEVVPALAPPFGVVWIDPIPDPYLLDFEFGASSGVEGTSEDSVVEEEAKGGSTAVEDGASALVAVEDGPSAQVATPIFLHPPCRA
jgi:hypothetical protein